MDCQRGGKSHFKLLDVIKWLQKDSSHDWEELPDLIDELKIFENSCEAMDMQTAES